MNEESVNNNCVSPDLYQGVISRLSIAALVEPAPDQEVIRQVIQAGMTAPDHGKLSPWRFKLFSGQERQTLGEAFVKAAEQKGKSALSDRERCLAMPFRAPLVIAVVARVQAHPKIPALEQRLAVGACVQNMQLALQSFGFGSIWRTGEMAYDEVVKGHLDLLPEDEIIAFLYVGTPKTVARRQTLPNIESYLL
jgi:nitroreductase